MPGRRGLKGRIGKSGPQGIMGPPGKHGKQGKVGPEGPMGLKGDKGEPGPQGMQGLKGTPGESIALPEVFVSRDSLTVSENQSASFLCSAKGNPRPVIKWMKDGRLISNNRIKITSHGELKISSSQYNDTGSYTCKAENLLGQANVTVQLAVEGKY